jgi:hypothetical protein
LPAFRLGAGRSALWQRHDPPAKRFGDPPLESLLAKRPAAIRRSTQIVEESVFERGPKHRPVSHLPLSLCPADPVVKFMTGHKRIGCALGMGAIARPTIARATVAARHGRLLG